MSLSHSLERFLSEIETELQAMVTLADGPRMAEYRKMMAYHMGWEDDGFSGKRLRPLFTLLTCEAAGGLASQALPAAAGVELIHNFSLIHDDIQDNSPLRRGRETVWMRWGRAQAINAGDALFSLAWLAGPRLLERNVAPEIALEVTRCLAMALLRITQGQHLDMAFESRAQVSITEYMDMIGGKTAELLAAAVEAGAIVAGASLERRRVFRSFGFNLGLAFQIQDDLLGIWGNSGSTGKSTASDLEARKKSLPVVFACEKSADFARRFARPPERGEDPAALAAELEALGARDYTLAKAAAYTQTALRDLKAAQPAAGAEDALSELAAGLVGRAS